MDDEIIWNLYEYLLLGLIMIMAIPLSPIIFVGWIIKKVMKWKK
jgi:hypothetical protein